MINCLIGRKELIKIRNCFLSIPRQLARENKNRKFKYAEVEKGVGARKYINSVEWLRNVSMAEMAHNIEFGYKFMSGNVGVAGKKITLPHYMMMFI